MGMILLLNHFWWTTKDGVFVTSVHVYFSAKSTSTPVQVQIRTMTNGYPTQTIVPFGTSFCCGC